jgi:hypothetical protein
MARKSRRNKSVCHAAPKRPQPSPARLEVLFQRKDQATTLREMMERHRGEIPVRVLYEMRAIRLGGAV